MKTVRVQQSYPESLREDQRYIRRLGVEEKPSFELISVMIQWTIDYYTTAANNWLIFRRSAVCCCMLLVGGGSCSTLIKFDKILVSKILFWRENSFLGQSSLSTHLPLFSNFSSKKNRKKCKHKLLKTGEKSYGKSMFLVKFSGQGSFWKFPFSRSKTENSRNFSGNFVKLYLDIVCETGFQFDFGCTPNFTFFCINPRNTNISLAPVVRDLKTMYPLPIDSYTVL